MSKQIDALKLALEALEECRRDPRLKYEHPTYDKTITAIKEALNRGAMDSSPNGETQPEQRSVSENLKERSSDEPVAWWIPKAEQFCFPSSDGTRPFAKAWEPLYTTPPQRTWVGLTDDEIEMIVENKRAAHWEFVRQVEAKLKEKNT